MHARTPGGSLPVGSTATRRRAAATPSPAHGGVGGGASPALSAAGQRLASAIARGGGGGGGGLEAELRRSYTPTPKGGRTPTARGGSARATPKLHTPKLPTPRVKGAAPSPRVDSGAKRRAPSAPAPDAGGASITDGLLRL